MTKKNHKVNEGLLYTIFILSILGIIILASASMPFSQRNYGSPFYITLHQLIYGFFPGIVLLVIMTKIPIPLLKKYAFHILIINLVFLGAVFLPKVGTNISGSRRWINLGFLSFQPSEFLKLSFIIYFSAWISKRLERKEKISEMFIGFLVITGLISLFLILQPDMSTLGIIVAVAFSMYIVSGMPLWHNIVIVILGAGISVILIKLAPYRMNRILVFLKPELDPLGIGYQLKQSFIAIGSGGLKGLGLGMSQQKFGYIPSPSSDAIFSIFAEETGFLGALFLVLIFILLLFQGLKIAKLSKEDFSKFMAFGITVWIVLQAFVNMSSMMGLLPITGIPMPLVSFGGSAIIVELAGLGILLNISKYT